MQQKRRTFRYDKIVRDKVVPDLLDNQNAEVVYTHLSGVDAIQALKAKLIEEALEVSAASTLDELKMELADVLEVVEGLIKAVGSSTPEVARIQEQKRAERGGFSGVIFVQTVTLDEKSRVAVYCLSHPDRYPEVIKE